MPREYEDAWDHEAPNRRIGVNFIAAALIGVTIASLAACVMG